MKVRTNWLIAGEKNTTFFHLSTMIHRSTNQISCVKNEDDEWIYNVEEVKQHFIKGFLKLYLTDLASSSWDNKLEMNCYVLTNEEAMNMVVPPSYGLHTGFF